MSEKAKAMYAIYHNAETGAVVARSSEWKCRNDPGITRMCTVVASDNVEAFDIFIALEGIGYEVPTGV